MEVKIQSPIISANGNLQVNLTYHENDWFLSAQNLCDETLKRVLIFLYPKPPVFVSEEKFRFGSVPALSHSQPQRLSLRIDHPIFSVNKHDNHEQDKAKTIITPQFRINLLQALNIHMNLDEIRTLCFHLNIEYENIAGETRERKAKELIDYCQRKLIILQLLETCHILNPAAPWPEILSSEKEFQKSDEVEIVENLPSQTFKLGFKAIYRISNSAEMQQFQSGLGLTIG